MTQEQLEKGIELQKEISKLDSFISIGQKLWRGKLIIRKLKMIFGLISYGWLEGKELKLDTETKDEVLEFIIAKRDRLKKELEEIN